MAQLRRIETTAGTRPAGVVRAPLLYRYSPVPRRTTDATGMPQVTNVAARGPTQW